MTPIKTRALPIPLITDTFLAIIGSLITVAIKRKGIRMQATPTPKRMAAAFRIRMIIRTSLPFLFGVDVYLKGKT